MIKIESNVSSFKVSKPMIIIFSSTTCNPCKIMIKMLEDLEKNYPSYIFCQIKIEENLTITNKYNIKSVPSILKINDNNQIINQLVGACSISKLKSFIED